MQFIFEERVRKKKKQCMHEWLDRGNNGKLHSGLERNDAK